jgi:hypothetical protein
MMSTYYLNRFPHPPIRVEIEQDPPPCLLCDAPVTMRSMGGPLICVPCDMGRNPDGTKVTPAQHAERNRRARAKIQAFQAAETARVAATPLEDPEVVDQTIVAEPPIPCAPADAAPRIVAEEGEVHGIMFGIIDRLPIPIRSSMSIDSFVKFCIVQSPTKEDPK